MGGAGGLRQRIHPSEVSHVGSTCFLSLTEIRSPSQLGFSRDNLNFYESSFRNSWWNIFTDIISHTFIQNLASLQEKVSDPALVRKGVL